MHWIALQPAPEVVSASPAGDAPVDLHTALAWWALQFTPLVARVEQALVLEVSASQRLFGGGAALMQRLMASRPADVVHTQGSTALLALARLWAGDTDAAIDSLPLHTLVAARDHLPTLQRLGCANWGHVRALPRAGLARRFGADLLEALDQAYGLRPERYAWLTLPDVFDTRLELLAAVESAPALLFGARRLLAQLLVWLRARQQGVLALELVWELDARRSNAQHMDAHHRGTSEGRLELRTAEATQDMQHLQRLLAEQLERVQLPAPVLYLRLRSLQTQGLAGESHSLLLEDQRKGDSLHQTLERLAARLGSEQLLCVQPQANHLPEQMQSWQPWKPERSTAASAAAARVQHRHGKALSDQAALLPTWLLPEPQPLSVRKNLPQYHGPLRLLAGPQRLETGWLEGAPALRDYFIAHSERCGLVWIYRERLSEAQDGQKKTSASLRWFLHGVFA